MSSLLQGSDIAVRLAGRRVLDGVAAAVDEGELVGLIGPNGAGKSTLLRALAGLQPREAGSVEFDGTPIEAIDRRDMARFVSYLPQSGTSHWDVTVETLVTMGRLPHLGRWDGPGADDRRAVARAMARTDVADLAGRKVTQLSGGELSRVLLARALAGEPKLLLADEPVSGLDPAHQLDVMDLLRDMVRQGGAAVVVLHELSLAARYCHRLILLDGGRKVADGAPEEVLSDDNLARSYGIRAYQGRTGAGLFIVPESRIDGEPGPGP